MRFLIRLLLAPCRRLWYWLDERTGIRGALDQFLRHPVPPGATTGKSSFMYVLGFATLCAFLLQLATGAALATKYIPSTAHAYESVAYITGEVALGRMLRGMHYFGASAMVLLVTLHMARVFLTASYKYPRELSWISGVLLFGLTMAMALTGQLLRWNEDGVWAVVVAAYFAGRVPLVGEWLGRFILGGDVIGGETLSRFYAFHVFFLPAIIILLIGFHMAQVLHNGISEPPKAGRPVDPRTYRAWYRSLLERHGRPYWPDSAWKELVAGALVVLVVAALALTVGPRDLGLPADPDELAQDPRPDWFLIWYYALLAVKPRGTEDLVMVYAPLLLLVSFLVLPLIASRGERSLSRRPWAVVTVGVATACLGTLILLGYQRPWVPVFDAEPVSAEALGITDPVAVEGARLFAERGCQTCHAVAGRGGSWGPDLTDVSARLSPGEITVRIVAGIGDMPAYRDILTPDEVNALVGFLRSTRPVEPGRQGHGRGH
jgi:ubiquinol-cytochrome c reductase cytochrome b subunit